jgi:MOSC domain-containing protein YiiM
MNGRIYQLNCSDGGVPKLAVREAFLTPNGLEGDRQRDLRVHGGPDRALCLYALERILALQAEGHPIYPGSIGENLTIVGLDWQRLEPGARLAIGDEVIIEISKYAGPCKNIRGSFSDGDFNRVSQKLHTGTLAVGQTVRLLNGKEH